MKSCVWSGMITGQIKYQTAILLLKICIALEKFIRGQHNVFLTTFLVYLSKGLFTRRWGTPGRCGNPPESLIIIWSRIHNRWGDYTDRRVTPPKQVTSPTWGPPPLCQQAPKQLLGQTFVLLKGKLICRPQRDNPCFSVSTSLARILQNLCCSACHKH